MDAMDARRRRANSSRFLQTRKRRVPTRNQPSRLPKPRFPAQGRPVRPRNRPVPTRNRPAPTRNRPSRLRKLRFPARDRPVRPRRQRFSALDQPARLRERPVPTRNRPSRLAKSHASRRGADPCARGGNGSQRGDRPVRPRRRHVLTRNRSPRVCGGDARARGRHAPLRVPRDYAMAWLRLIWTTSFRVSRRTRP